MTDTSVRMDKELAREVKIEAAKRGVSVKQLIEDAVRVELKKKSRRRG